MPKSDRTASFWEKVNKRGAIQPRMRTCCWEWLAGKDRNGYGRFRWEGSAKYAPRVAWELATGSPPTSLVLHECDNPSCVRFSHLFEGTHADNMLDRAAKGRTASGLGSGRHTKPARTARGVRHGRSKLTEKQVHAMRLAFAKGTTRSALAAKYRLHWSSVDCTVRGIHWAHV